MFIIPIVSQIVWFIFAHRNRTSTHLKMVQTVLHQGIHWFIFGIHHIRKIFGETALRTVILLENALKMVSSIDLTHKKMIELKNDILAQKNKNILVAKEANFNMAWNAQDWNDFD